MIKLKAGVGVEIEGEIFVIDLIRQKEWSDGKYIILNLISENLYNETMGEALADKRAQNYARKQTETDAKISELMLNNEQKGLGGIFQGGE